MIRPFLPISQKVTDVEDLFDGFWCPLADALRQLSQLTPTETYVPDRRPVCTDHWAILEDAEEGVLFEFTEECLGPTDNPACGVARIVSFEGEPEWTAAITVPGSYLVGVGIREEYDGQYDEYIHVPFLTPQYPEELGMRIYPA